MKYIIMLSLLLTGSLATGQNTTIIPTTPKLGESILITYHENVSNSAIVDVLEVTAEALIDRGDLEPLLIEVPLKKDGDVWSGTFSVNDDKGCFILYKIVSGSQKDDNNGNPITSTILGENGKPIQGAHLSSGNFSLNGRFWDFKCPVDLKQAKAEFEKEKKLYPGSWRATVGLWEISLKDNNTTETKKKVRKDLDKFYAINNNDESVVAVVISWYERLEDTLRASEIREAAIIKNPDGKIAQSKRSVELRKEKDNLKRAELLQNILDDFPEMENGIRQSYTLSLVRSYIQAKDYEKASLIISRMEKPDPGMYNSIAWPLIEQGEQLERGIVWAKLGLDIARNRTITDKPSYMNKKDWEENNKYTLAMILDTYGSGLLKLNRNDEALTNFHEAYITSEAGDPDMNSHYTEVLLKCQKHDKVIETGLSCIKKGKDTPVMIDQMKEAFAKAVAENMVYDSLDADQKTKFASMIEEALRIKIEEIRRKLRESRVIKPSIDFTLNDLNGTPITLSALKGKVVIVDFWATWCGPCKMSFPYLQKVYEKYQNNQYVKFLAVNSWERQKDDAEQLANAKKFIEENKYTFHVVMDKKKDDQYQVITDYDVEGIPTKFIIDKKGNIAFKSVGFDGPAMEDELIQQIEMLLAE